MLDLPYLRGYWQRILGHAEAPAGARDLDHTMLSGLGLGMLETLRHLHGRRPAYEEFERWIAGQNGGSIALEQLDRLRLALAGDTVGPLVRLDDEPGLSAADLQHFAEHGYVVLRQAVSAAQAGAAEAAIYQFLGMDPVDPESWYSNPQGHSIWVNLLRHPSFLENRRSARIHRAFAQLWGRDDLWPTVDQGGLNPPERPGWPFPGPHLHWDTTLAAPHHFGLQGILYLADVAGDQGAFCCIPSFHRKLAEWLAKAGPDPRNAVLRHDGVKPIAAAAGDMVIWHQSLPHGSSPNRNTRPRVAQYITLKPTRWAHHAQWA